MDVRPDFIPMLLRWQRMVDLLARMSGMPYAMINRWEGEELVVQAVSRGLEIYHADQRIDFQLNTYCARTLRQGQPQMVEDARLLPVMHDNPTAQAGLVAYYGLPIRHPDGRLFGTLCMLDTQPRRPDEQARELIAMLRDGIEQDLALLMRNAELAASEARAGEASRAKTDFMARVNHELRTPLGAVLGFAQLLEMDAGAPLTATQQQRVQQQRVQHIRRAGDHLLAMIDEMMDISRIEAGQLRMAPQACELGPQLAEALAQCRGQADEAGVTLPDVPAGLPCVMADPRRLHQVLLNLLSNAIKYNRRGGTVRLGLAQGASLARLQIEDTGIGMDEVQLAQLFQPFNRLGRERSGVAGTGLGMALSRQLVELMGGRIEVSSHVDEGTTVSLTLPLAD